MRLALIIIAIVVLTGCGTIEEQKVGGDRDEHGCIPSAGYIWCEAKEKCIRPWEETCEEQIDPLQQKAKGIAIDYIKDSRPAVKDLQITEVIEASCEGCYLLIAEYETNGTDTVARIGLNNWEVVDDTVFD